MTKAPHTKIAYKGRKQVSALIYGLRACDATWFDGRAAGTPFYQPVKAECNSTKVVNAHDAALPDGRATKMQRGCFRISPQKGSIQHIVLE